MANNVRSYSQEWKKDENGTILVPDEILLKGAIEDAKMDLIFTPLGGKQSQPKHKGDKMIKRMKLGVLHRDNRLDNGLNTNAATFMTNTWFAYSAIGVQIGDPKGYSALVYGSAAAAEAAAQVVADAAQAGVGLVKSGAGTAYWGDADYNTVNDGIPELGEEGGDVNAVNVSSKYVYGTVKKRGIQSTWYKDAIDKDNRPGLLVETSQGLVEAVRDLREAEVQSLLLAAASANVVFPAESASVAMSTLTSQDELTYTP